MCCPNWSIVRHLHFSNLFKDKCLNHESGMNEMQISCAAKKVKLPPHR